MVAKNYIQYLFATDRVTLSLDNVQGFRVTRKDGRHTTMPDDVALHVMRLPVSNKRRERLLWSFVP